MKEIRMGSCFLLLFLIVSFENMYPHQRILTSAEFNRRQKRAHEALAEQEEIARRDQEKQLKLIREEFLKNQQRLFQEDQEGK